MKIRNNLIELVRFGVVGVAATLTYFFLFYGLAEVGMPVLASHVTASFTSLVFSYFGHKKYTFKHSGRNSTLGKKFVVSTAIIAGTQFLFIASLDRNFELPNIVMATLGTLYFPSCSYFIHKFWTFRAAYKSLTENEAG